MRIGIVSVQSSPPDLKGWIAHHLRIGVAQFFLRWEGSVSDADRAVLDSHRDVVQVIEHEVEMDATPGSVCKRQEKFATLVANRYADTDWLLHIDADELLHCPVARIDRVFESVPTDTKTVRFDNLEAVLESEDEPIETLFGDEHKVLFRSGKAAYGNGKAGTRVGVGNNARGCHWFSAKPVFNLPQRSLCVLHFDSLEFDDWHRRFSRRKDISEAELRNTPFQYYKDSVTAIRKHGNDHAALYAVFRKYRTAVGHVELGESPLRLRRILFHTYPQVGASCLDVSTPSVSLPAPLSPHPSSRVETGLDLTDLGENKVTPATAATIPNIEDLDMMTTARSLSPRLGRSSPAELTSLPSVGTSNPPSPLPTEPSGWHAVPQSLSPRSEKPVRLRGDSWDAPAETEPPHVTRRFKESHAVFGFTGTTGKTIQRRSARQRLF